MSLLACSEDWHFGGTTVLSGHLLGTAILCFSYIPDHEAVAAAGHVQRA
jgi:hypothetical protein